MKKVGLLAIITLCFSFNVAFAQNEDSDAIKKRVQDSYMQFLKEEGFSPSVDEDGDVKFKMEGVTYYMQPSDDPLYLSVARFLSNTEKVHDLKIYDAIDKTNREYKVVKVFLSENYSNLIIKASNYLHEEDDFKHIFYRCLKRIKNGEDLFKETYNK